jgi:energy-coupling factor transporter ATP-binding protein EcfA2
MPVLDGLGRPGRFDDVNVAVRCGEIVGFDGLVGSGLSEIAAYIYGVDHATGGKMRLNDKCIVPRRRGGAEAGRGGIDLSVGAIVLLAGMVFGFAYGEWGWPLPPTILLSAAFGALRGALNGFLVAAGSRTTDRPPQDRA